MDLAPSFGDEGRWAALAAAFAAGIAPDFVIVRFIGRAKTSGMDLAQMQTKQASLLQIRRGKVTRLVTYWENDRAFADLRLTPDTGT